MAVVPIADPLMDDLTRTNTTLSVPDDALIEETLARIENSAALEPLLVQQAFAGAEVWPAQGDWLVVSCWDDGTARYGIAPGSAGARVTNPQEACGAILREID